MTYTFGLIEKVGYRSRKQATVLTTYSAIFLPAAASNPTASEALLYSTSTPSTFVQIPQLSR
jgi:hypothetical protein